MQVYVDPAPGGEATNLALGHLLARRAEREDSFEALHVYRPSGRSVVFGRRETRAPGFGAAVRAATAAGFEPLVRATGGRAVAYTEQTVVVHHVRHDEEPIGGHDARFVEIGHRLVDVMRTLGVEARLGAVPGEYCPGAHSVNARGETKLIGTAQRVLRQAWLFASLVVVGDEEELRPVLTEVYGHLGQDFDAASVGSLSAENPALEPGAVARALLTAFAGATPTLPISALGELLDDADQLAGDHRV
ncbi:putative lipoate-protein ligase A [Nocardioides sp. CF8]|uniref:lipoate--protein ligase family protein n=1 Tax=Nocardioides sp. CF8 TaxID=110319 RepID=UPI00032ED8A2|nr:lipoate--protein ligase family protein [Nocardioides sp. CF8]EON22327.1 putative lipoate-protein ligase A [Nocardioides sp. CF8]